jgi:hypothetical protein
MIIILVEGFEDVVSEHVRRPRAILVLRKKNTKHHILAIFPGPTYSLFDVKIPTLFLLTLKSSP